MIYGLNETEEFTEALITKYVDKYRGKCGHIKVKCSVINVDLIERLLHWIIQNEVIDNQK